MRSIWFESGNGKNLARPDWADRTLVRDGRRASWNRAVLHHLETDAPNRSGSSDWLVRWTAAHAVAKPNELERGVPGHSTPERISLARALCYLGLPSLAGLNWAQPIILI